MATQKEPCMRCSEIMSRDYIVCSPKTHLCDIRESMGNQLYAVAIEEAKPRGVVPGEVLAKLSIADRHDPERIVERTLLPVSRCSANESLGKVGATILRERSFAAVLYRDDILVGVAPLLDIMHWLITAPCQPLLLCR